jgi:hypothetical protein
LRENYQEFYEMALKETIVQLIGGDRKRLTKFNYISVLDSGGLSFGASLGYGGVDILKGDGSKIATTKPIDFKLTTLFDLGYLYNSSSLSDLFAGFSLSIAKESLTFDGLNNFDTLKSNFLYGYELSLLYKYYPRGLMPKFFYGIFFSFGTSLSGKWGGYDVEYYNRWVDSAGVENFEYGDGQLNLFTQYIDGDLGLHYSLSPNSELKLGLSYKYPVYSFSVINSDGKSIKMDYMDSSDFSFSKQMEWSLGYYLNW